MKILVFHQPFPGGNYKLNEVLANELTKLGHEVYLLEQLHGRQPTKEWVELIQRLDPDAIYFEMLDLETFKVVEKIKCLKVLTFASNGILKSHLELPKYHKKWFDKVLTNSKVVFDFLKKKNIPVEHFKFYHSVIYKNESQPEKTKQVVFLGMGFNRLVDPSYQTEKDLFFSLPYREIDYSIYGNGWPDNYANCRGVLPPDDIEQLYNSSISAVGIIAQGQRNLGMVNNRYTEMLMGKTIPISYRYNIDWFGLDNYIEFVDSRHGFISTANEASLIYKNKSAEYWNRIDEAMNFMNYEQSIFYQKLNSLLC